MHGGNNIKSTRTLLQPPLPVCCPSDAFSAVTEASRRLDGQPTRPINNKAMLAAAVAVGRIATGDELPIAQAIGSANRRIRAIADRVRSRVQAPNPRTLLAHLHHVMFDELGFAGEPEDYLDPAASDVLTTLQTGQGLPVTLALAYKLVAENLGLTVHGLGLPGHFVVSVDILPEAGQKVRPQRLTVDPFFGGQVLHADEAFARVAGIVGLDANELAGEGHPLVAETHDALLRPVTRLHWVTRIIQNLLNLLSARDAWPSIAALLEIEIALWPNQPRLHRDLALVLARGNFPQQASVWLGCYLRDNPTDPQGEDLRQLLQVLQK